jgi:hypothetical protein
VKLAKKSCDGEMEDDVGVLAVLYNSSRVSIIYGRYLWKQQVKWA